MYLIKSLLHRTLGSISMLLIGHSKNKLNEIVHQTAAVNLKWLPFVYRGPATKWVREWNKEFHKLAEKNNY